MKYTIAKQITSSFWAGYNSGAGQSLATVGLDGEQWVAHHPIRTEPKSTARCVPRARQGADSTTAGPDRASCMPGLRVCSNETPRPWNAKGY